MAAPKIGKVNWLDILKGAGIAALSSILTAIVTFGQAGEIPTFWRHKICNPDCVITHGWDIPVYAALSVFAAYILKNLVTNSEGKMFTKEPKSISNETIKNN